MTTLDVALVIQNAVRRDGQGRVMVEIASELVRRGHRVTVYSHRLDEQLADRVAFRPIPHAPGPQIVDDVAMLLRVSRAVRRGNHDVACALGHTAVTRCPLVLNLQFSHRGWRESWTRASRPALRHRLHVRTAAALEALCVRRADRVIASTPVLAREVAEGRDVEVSVVPNGVDLDEFDLVTPAERSKARTDFGLQPDEFAVAFLGDYHTPRKGLDQLLLAVAAGPTDERLVVAARGDDDGLLRRAGELGIVDRVILAGFASPRTVMAAADAVAVPSLYEPFSLVAVEAAACGVPVVLSARAGAAALLGPGAVIVDDPENPSHIRTALDAVRADPGLREDVVAGGRRAVAGLTWETSASLAADAIEEVARRSSKEPVGAR